MSGSAWQAETHLCWKGKAPSSIIARSVASIWGWSQSFLEMLPSSTLLLYMCASDSCFKLSHTTPPNPGHEPVIGPVPLWNNEAFTHQHSLFEIQKKFKKQNSSTVWTQILQHVEIIHNFNCGLPSAKKNLHRPLMSGTVFTYTQIDKKIYVPLPGTQVRRMATGNLWTWEKRAIRIYQDNKQIQVKSCGCDGCLCCDCQDRHRWL